MSNYKLVKNTEWKEVEINGEVKEVPVDWTIDTIGETIKLNMGNTPKKELDNYSGDLPWITISNLTEKNISNYTAKIKRNKNVKIFPKGTLLISFKMSVGKTGFTTEDSAINEAIMGIKEKDTINNINYLYYCLPNVFISNAMPNGQGLLLLNQDKIKNLTYVIPPTQAQSAIASILSEQESIIQDIEYLISKYESRFKYLSDELLSGRLRVKEIDGEVVLYKNPEDNWKEVEINGEMKEIPKDWEVDTFMSFLKFKNGSAFKPSEWKDSGIPIVRIQNLTNKEAPINYFQGDKKGLIHLQSGDYLFSWSGTIDVFQYEGPNAILNQHIFKVENNNNNNLEYFIILLKNEIKNMNTNGLTMSHITLAELKSFNFSYTKNNKEQKLVSGIINEQEYLINQQKELLIKEKQKFNWLLDNLLSGKYLIKE